MGLTRPRALMNTMLANGAGHSIWSSVLRQGFCVGSSRWRLVWFAPRPAVRPADEVRERGMVELG
jgi:hypothetical protein